MVRNIQLFLPLEDQMTDWRVFKCCFPTILTLDSGENIQASSLGSLYRDWTLWMVFLPHLMQLAVKIVDCYGTFINFLKHIDCTDHNSWQWFLYFRFKLWILTPGELLKLWKSLIDSNVVLTAMFCSVISRLDSYQNEEGQRKPNIRCFQHWSRKHHHHYLLVDGTFYLLNSQNFKPPFHWLHWPIRT